MASLDDVVTVQKNGVVGINALTAALEAFKTVYNSFVGNQTFLGVADNSLVTTNAGRLVNVSVITAVAGGTIHDAASVSAATTSNAIYVIPNQQGIVQANMPFTDGLVIKPAAGSVVSISYSED